MKLDIILPPHNNFNDWLNLYNPFSDYFEKVDGVVVNFGNVTFVEPKHIVILSCFLELYYRNKNEITFVNINNNVNLYLNNIGFVDYFNINQQRKGYASVGIFSTIPLWNIEPIESFQYSTYAQNFLQQNFLRNKDLIFIQSNLDEIFNNISDHSDCVINGYVLTQMYPNINKIVFSVCDLGVGIPTSINQMLIERELPTLLDSEAIIHSTIATVSSMSKPHNRGLGLSNIVGLCHDDLGKVEIYSNKGYFNTSENIPNYDYETDFMGTLINITIDTTKLENQDGEELHFFTF